MFQLPDEIILEMGTGICYGNLVDGVFFGNGDGDMTDIVTEFQSIFSCVLYQRLETKCRDINMGNVIRHMQLEVQPVSETDLLDPDIIL